MATPDCLRVSGCIRVRRKVHAYVIGVGMANTAIRARPSVTKHKAFAFLVLLIIMTIIEEAVVPAA